MKLNCNPADLSEALSVVSKAIPSRTDIPVLEGIKILAEGDTVTLTASDLEIFIERKMKGEIELEGECVVIGKFFTEFVRKLNGLDSISLELNGDKLEIGYGDNKGEIQCLNVDTFPEMRQVDDDIYFKIKERELKDVLDKTIFCVAIEDSRPILKGVLMELKEQSLTAVAVDGYRLAVGKTTLIESKGDASIIVPGKTLNEVSKIFSDTDDEVKVNVQKNNIMFDIGHTKIIARLIEGEYIKYTQIIPNNCDTSVVIKRDAFEHGLDRAGLIARNQKNNYLKLSLGSDEIVIKSDSQIGKIREVVKCNVGGKEMEIAFNAKYLFDALNRIKDEVICIDLISSNAPALIRPLEGEAYKYVVLPVRLMGN